MMEKKLVGWFKFRQFVAPKGKHRLSSEHNGKKPVLND
jgi:hypothetical protein